MIKYEPVDLPDRTVRVASKSGTYVYLTQKVEYSSTLKRSIPTRIVIGKLNDDGKLIPNKNYFSIYGEKVELLERSNRSDFISFGLNIIIDTIARKSQLYDLLDSIFEDNTNKILDIASYMILKETSAMQYFEDYGYNHHLFNLDNFTDNTIGRLFDLLKVKDIDLFISSWVKMHSNKDIYVSYDSTNMNSTSGTLELAEYGHAKDNDNLPQVNLSLGYDQSNNTPLFYELYPGSIIDNSECKKMVDRAKYYGLNNIGFILDRGYFSIDNIKYFENNGYDYILMTKGNSKFIKEAVDTCVASLRNGVNHYIEEYELYGKTIETKLFDKDSKQYVHVYYDGLQAEREKINIYNRLNAIDKLLDEKIKAKLQRKEDLKPYDDLYKVNFDVFGYFTSYKRKDNKIKELLNKAGVFVIVTSKEMSAEKALNIYRDRDAIEKVFRMEKSYLGCDVFRVSGNEKLESKVFISFIALILRNEIYQSIKPLYKKNRKEYTVPKVLQQLERLGITKLSDNKYHQRYLLTKRQKDILNVFNINEKEYKAYSEKIENQMNEI